MLTPRFYLESNKILNHRNMNIFERKNIYEYFIFINSVLIKLFYQVRINNNDELKTYHINCLEMLLDKLANFFAKSN